MRQSCMAAPVGAAFQSTTSLLPMAMGTGKLRIVTDAMGQPRVVTDARGKAKGVEYIDKKEGTTRLSSRRAPSCWRPCL